MCTVGVYNQTRVFRSPVETSFMYDNYLILLGGYQQSGLVDLVARAKPKQVSS